jgi:hypothetical protein
VNYFHGIHEGKALSVVAVVLPSIRSIAKHCEYVQLVRIVKCTVVRPYVLYVPC